MDGAAWTTGGLGSAVDHHALRPHVLVDFVLNSQTCRSQPINTTQMPFKDGPKSRGLGSRRDRFRRNNEMFGSGVLPSHARGQYCTCTGVLIYTYLAGTTSTRAQSHVPGQNTKKKGVRAPSAELSQDQSSELNTSCFFVGKNVQQYFLQQYVPGTCHTSCCCTRLFGVILHATCTSTKN